MSDLAVLFILSGITVGLITLVWWLIIVTEGVYLGRRMVIWLYDLYAHRYDQIKKYQPEYEHYLVAQPIMTIIAPHRSPMVLDVATGTGRLPLALLNHPAFQGRVIGLDLSRRMLHLAAGKLRPFGDRAPLLWTSAEDLPFANDTFDVVTALEALEFMTSPEKVLNELVRVLRPGGLLLITNRINTRAMPGKIWPESTLHRLLEDIGIEHVEIEPWQYDYQKVWALKAGESKPIGARPLGELLRCPRCRQHAMVQRGETWVCGGCDGTAHIAGDGIIELFPLV